ncbi:MAG TPA: phosphodiester glycosidase family protein [Vicinamibacterales bacterium]|nr:phosphodiester glycosidase family protein [Vicinamibacterales bacterium]
MRRALLIATFVLAVACGHRDPQAWLGAPRNVAAGLDYFQTTDATLVNNEGPIAIYLLRLDLNHVMIESALSNDEVMQAERVDAIAQRHQALAAINAGFFNVKNGEPVSLLKVAGELVSDNSLPRAVVAIQTKPGERQQFHFDQAAAKVQLRFRPQAAMEPRVSRPGDDTGTVSVPIDGVDTTRERGKLMLYTPMYHGDTDTAANGIEWIASGVPLTVREVRRDAGKSPIPRDGVVLSYGGLDPPAPLSGLAAGTVISTAVTWKILGGTPSTVFDDARDIINGAGLLRRDGVTMTNWQTAEELKPSTFLDIRHPRSLLGVDGRGFLWLAAIDGRQADHSIGMTFTELVGLCTRLDLRDAINLDGGGSTTLVVKGAIVNKPSDAAGPRPVSDAILVKSR